MPAPKEAASNMGITADEVTETTIRPKVVERARKAYYTGGYMKASELTPAEVVNVLEYKHEPLNLGPITTGIKHVVEHIPHPQIPAEVKPRPLISKLLHNISEFLSSPFKRHPHSSAV